ncbi:MAG: hypothetical protein Phyf2KO_15920 [Phycisphaerales bacterium]
MIHAIMTSLAAIAAATVHAQPISIVNASFEDDPADAGCFEIGFAPNGWEVYDPDNIATGGDFWGVLNPGSTPYFLPGQVPDGEKVALLFFTGSTGQGGMGIRQMLGVNLVANRRYTLTVGVGDIASGASPSPPCSNGNFFDLDAFPGYAVQLAAGDVVIAEDLNSLFGSIPEGEFRISIVEVEIPAGHPQVDTELEIRLINLNMDDPTDPDDTGIEVDFDDVRLEVTDLTCIADVNGDGMLTPTDFTAWVNAFNNSLPGCDQNGDGSCAPTDFTAWLANFNAGCS